MANIRYAALFFFSICCATTAAQASELDDFLVKATALEKKGALAVFSGDFKPLKNQFERVSLQLRRERLAAVAAGQRPAYCPPAKSSLSPKELLAYLRTIPPAQRRRMNLREGLQAFYAHKFPCR